MSVTIEIDARDADIQVKPIAYLSGQVDLLIDSFPIRLTVDDLRPIVADAAALLPVGECATALLDSYGGDRLGELIALLQEAVAPPAVPS